MKAKDVKIGTEFEFSGKIYQAAYFGEGSYLIARDQEGIECSFAPDDIVTPR